MSHKLIVILTALRKYSDVDNPEQHFLEEEADWLRNPSLPKPAVASKLVDRAKSLGRANPRMNSVEDH